MHANTIWGVVLRLLLALMLYQFGRSCACRCNPLWLPVLAVMLKGAHKGCPYVWATYKIDTGSLAFPCLVEAQTQDLLVSEPASRVEMPSLTMGRFKQQKDC